MTWFYQVFFGTNISQGGEQTCVTKLCWESFLKEAVKPQFRSFTVYETVGFWKDEPETTPKGVMLLKCNDDDDDQATLSKLKQIKETYKRMFIQENVLVTRHQVEEY